MSTPYDPNDPSRKPDDERDFDDPDLREEKPKPGGDDDNGKDVITPICNPGSFACPVPDRPK